MRLNYLFLQQLLGIDNHELEMTTDCAGELESWRAGELESNANKIRKLLVDLREREREKSIGLFNC